MLLCHIKKERMEKKKKEGALQLPTAPNQAALCEPLSINYPKLITKNEP